jgi:hypothetical protein
LRVRILSITLIAAAIAIGLFAWLSLRPAPRATTPLTHEVYIWQRVWSGELKDALAAHGRAFARVVVLARQVDWQRSEAGEMVPKTFLVPLDWAALQNAGAPVGVAIRIAGYAGDFGRAAEAIAGVAGDLCDEAKTNGVGLSEIQIDFDCPSSRLDGYRQWMIAIKQRSGGVPVHITALPTWLDRADFAALAKESCEYVLQVHSLQRPTTVNDPAVLCDPAAAQAAVEKAGKIGVPFRVALPTYGYILIYDAAGKYLGLEAEGQEQSWPADAQQRWLGADSTQLAQLINDWNANRPIQMTGIIWYRLPIAQDKLNWRWPTLAAVMAGRTPAAAYAVELRPGAANVDDVIITNTGDGDLRGPLNVSVDMARDIAARDALGGFATLNATDRRWTLEGLDAVDDRIGPGEKRNIGWVRYK